MFRVLTFLAVGLLLCGTALGGPLLNHADAWTDWEARTWTGTTHFESAGGELAADVEWAVFGPGDCPYSDSNFPAPAVDEFVYAYQINNTGGTLEVNLFWVNMKVSNEATGIGWFDLSPGVAPVSADWGNSDPQDRVSAEWTFPSDLTVGEVSDGLAYSSVNAPIDWFGYIQDGGQSGTPQGALPSPGDVIPEPATIGLLLLGAGALIGLRRRGS